MQREATKKASQTDDPVIPTASPGKTKIPLSIPPTLTAIAPGKDNVLCSFFIVLNIKNL